MKKYRLLIETNPDIPPGSIATKETDSMYYEVTMPSGQQLSGRMFPEQIENRPEVWEEIVEQAEEQTEVQNEYLPFEPKENEKYWYIDYDGDLIWSIACGSQVTNNVFRTKEAVEYEKLRQESMSKRWKPDFEDEYYCYHFNHDRVYNPEWKASMENIQDYFIGNVHRTKKEAEQWADKYAEAWRVLL